MHILKKNEKLNIDNTILSINEIQKKLVEESKEALYSLMGY